MRDFIITLLATLILFLPNISVFSQSNIETREAIQEILFRKMILKWDLNGDERIKVYYVAVNKNKDPSKKLLAKLRKYSPRIKRVSEADVKEDVKDKQTTEPGVLFSIGKIVWKSKNKVEVNAYDYLGNMAAYGCDYTLELENSTWEITKTENCWIS